MTEPTESKEGYRKCPYCAEEIKAEAIKCKHCGSILQEADNGVSVTKERATKTWPKRMAIIITALVGVGLVGGAVFLWKAWSDAGENSRMDKMAISGFAWSGIAPVCWDSHLTTPQRKEKYGNYQGNKVKWTGTVYYVQESEKTGEITIAIQMSDEALIADRPEVILRMKKGQREQVLKLARGSTVSFIGVLGDATRLGRYCKIELLNGEIVE